MYVVNLNLCAIQNGNPLVFIVDIIVAGRMYGEGRDSYR